MANVKNPKSFEGSEWWTVDTTADIEFGDYSPHTIGSVVFQVEGSGYSIVPQVAVNNAGNSLSYADVWYTKWSDGTTVGTGTAITTDGVYSCQLDHGMKFQLSCAMTGSVDIVLRRGQG